MKAPDWTKADKVERTKRPAKVTWKAITKLKPGESIKDHAAVGLRWRCIVWNARGRAQSTIIAEYRYTHPVTGKAKSLSLGRLPTEDEAILLAAEGQSSGVFHMDEVLEGFRKLAWEWRRKVRAGLDPTSKVGAEGLTVAQACELQLEHCRVAERSPATIRTYKFSHQHLAHWENVPLRKVTPAMCRELHQRIGEKAGNKSMANETLQVFGAAWTRAKVEDPSLPDFPGKGVTRYPTKQKATGLPLPKLKEWFAKLASIPEPRRSLYYLGSAPYLSDPISARFASYR